MGADTGVGLTAAEFFGIAVGDLSPLVPIQLLQWTPNYSGAGFVQITEWEPDNNFEITVVFYRDQTAVDSDIWGHRTQNNKLIYQQSTNTIRLRPNTGGALLELSGILGGLNFLRLSKTGTDIVADLNGSETTIPNVSFSEINVFGASNGVLEWDGQIHTIRLTDLDNPANSRFYRSIIDSVTLPDSLVLRDELGDGSTNGTLTGFPTAQRWVPVLGTNQAYVGNLTATNVWLNGVGVGRFGVGRFGLTADATSGAAGSWGENAATVVPVGSLVKSGSVVGFVDVVAGNNFINVIRVNNEADAQIQAAFEYPNVFDIDVFDSATEAYNGDRNDGTYIRGVNINISGMSAGDNEGRARGSYFGTANIRFSVGDVLTADNGYQVLISSFSLTNASFTYEVITGTEEEIQQGFQWPNHFTVTPP